MMRRTLFASFLATFCAAAIGQGPIVQTDIAPPAVRSYAPQMMLYYPAPDYDCYSHNRGWLECYPGWCERHYRRPYNYRVKLDYPWHEDVYRNFPDAVTLDDCHEHEPVPAEAAAQFGKLKSSRAVKAARVERRDLIAPK